MSQQPQEKVFNVSIPESQVHVIGRALEALPYKEAAPVIGNIQQQINLQLQQEQAALDAAAQEAEQVAQTQESATADQAQQAE